MSILSLNVNKTSLMSAAISMALAFTAASAVVSTAARADYYPMGMCDNFCMQTGGTGFSSMVGTPGTFSYPGGYGMTGQMQPAYVDPRVIALGQYAAIQENGPYGLANVGLPSIQANLAAIPIENSLMATGGPYTAPPVYNNGGMGVASWGGGGAFVPGH